MDHSVKIVINLNMKSISSKMQWPGNFMWNPEPKQDPYLTVTQSLPFKQKQHIHNETLVPLNSCHLNFVPEDDQRAEGSLLWRKAERVVVVETAG